MHNSNILESKTSSCNKFVIGTSPPSLFSCPSSSSISKHWEAELEALKGNNAKLTAALLESTANVKQWKQQLAAYQEEAERLHKRVPVAAAVRELFPHPGEGSEGSRCVSGYGARVRERPNDNNQNPKVGTQPNSRGAGGGSEGQGGGEDQETRLGAKIGLTFGSSVHDFCKCSQELERLKAEVESANEFQTQKESLLLKLQVSCAQRTELTVLIFYCNIIRSNNKLHLIFFKR